jgi:hypothetical protein
MTDNPQKEAALKDPTACPGRYCFHWATAGTWVETQSVDHDSVEAAMRSDSLKQLTEDGCASVAACKRAGHEGVGDQYAPAGQELEADGLDVNTFEEPPQEPQ